MTPSALIRSISSYMSSRTLCPARYDAFLGPGSRSIRRVMAFASPRYPLHTPCCLRSISKICVFRVLSDNSLRFSSTISSQFRESSLISLVAIRSDKLSGDVSHNPSGSIPLSSSLFSGQTASPLDPSSRSAGVPDPRMVLPSCYEPIWHILL